jgi:hypothetical protein
MQPLGDNGKRLASHSGKENSLSGFREYNTLKNNKK